jgi:putative FmdB family regulatory protein
VPAYDYECPECGEQWEGVQPIDDRYKEKCPTCQEFAKIVIQNANAALPEYQEHYSWALGQRVGSRRELKRVLREKGLEDAGTTPQSEIEKIAKAEKKYQDKKAEKKEFQEFLKTYDRTFSNAG